MAMCKKCGARKRRWPRSCPRCRAGAGRAEAAADAADMAATAGLLGWIWGGVTRVVRLVLRALG